MGHPEELHNTRSKEKDLTRTASRYIYRTNEEGRQELETIEHEKKRRMETSVVANPTGRKNRTTYSRRTRVNTRIFGTTVLASGWCTGNRRNLWLRSRSENRRKMYAIR